MKQIRFFFILFSLSFSLISLADEEQAIDPNDVEEECRQSWYQRLIEHLPIQRLGSEVTILGKRWKSGDLDAIKVIEKLMLGSPEEFKNLDSRVLLSCLSGFMELTDDPHSLNIHHLGKAIFLSVAFPDFVRTRRKNLGRIVYFLIRNNKRAAAVGILGGLSTLLASSLISSSLHMATVDDNVLTEGDNPYWSGPMLITANQLLNFGASSIILGAGAKLLDYRNDVANTDRETLNIVIESFTNLARLFMMAVNFEKLSEKVRAKYPDPKLFKESVTRLILNISSHIKRYFPDWEEEMDSSRYSLFSRDGNNANGTKTFLSFFYDYWKVMRKAAKEFERDDYKDPKSSEVKNYPLEALGEMRDLREMYGSLHFLSQDITKNPYQDILDHAQDPNHRKYQRAWTIIEKKDPFFQRKERGEKLSKRDLQKIERRKTLFDLYKNDPLSGELDKIFEHPFNFTTEYPHVREFRRILSGEFEN